MSVTIYVPGETRADDGRLHVREFNLANGNFCRLMELIGLEIASPDDMIGQFSGDALADLRARAQFALDSVRAMPELDAGRPAEFITPNVIECGHPPGYYADRLARLVSVCELAILTGQPVCYG